MKHVIIAAAKLSVDATDLQIENAAKLIVQENEQLKRENAELKNSTAKAKAKILVDNLVDKKVIAESEREQWEKDATENYDVVQRAASKLKPVEQASKGINHSTDSNEPVDRSKWTIQDWAKNDPKAFTKMAEDRTTQYVELYLKEYGHEPSFK